MIPKRLDEVTEKDLLALITNAVGEGRAIDYKRELPGNSDGDKKEFLADVSSFANTVGGDLVFGISEDKGVPTQIVGLQSGDIDLEIRRLEDIMASGLDPRIRYATRVVDNNASKRALIIRVERSWFGPHRVTFKGHDKFYGRNSTGKYPLDVQELRLAFTQSTGVTDQIRAFRTDRIIALSNNLTPVPFEKAAKLVLHCIPIESFAGHYQHDMVQVYQQRLGLTMIGSTGGSLRYNLEGLLFYSGDSRRASTSYTQLYRNGIVEAVDSTGHQYEGLLFIPSVSFEKELMRFIPECFRLYQAIGVNTPIVIALTLTNARGLRMGVNQWRLGGGHELDHDTLIIPEAFVQDFSQPIGKILKPILDVVWNAFGFECSENFDSEGNWNPPR